MQTAVAQALADNLPVKRACARLVTTVCEALDWDAGRVWMPGAAGLLHCMSTWSRERPLANPQDPSWTVPVLPGHDLLGKVWQTGEPRWLEGLSEAHNFARTQAAELGGLLAGFAVPCCSSGSVFAVLEFFSHLSLSPDPALLTLLANAAAQIGLHMDSACAQSRALQAEQDRQLTVAIAQTSQVRFQQVLDTIPDLVLVKRPDSQIVWVNATMRAFYGMPPDGSGPIAEAPFNAPRNTQPYLADDVHVFATRQTLVIPVEAVTRFDGQVRYFHVVKPPIFDDQGRVAMLVIVCCYLGR